MSIRAINYNTDNTKSISAKKQKPLVKPYLEATGAIKTELNVKPLPPQGHLVHDNFSNSIKYFFKDIAYDLKSVKNGVKGTANDHQLGRHNDVGMVTAGLMIATYLASKTSDPRTRVMEYLGFGTFLAAMSIYPKIAINAPAKLLHGYDIDKEFIDDQGRKKSVQQDPNYVPYDMYQGEYTDEDLALIGDRMGIPRDIKNRNDLIKEQMRKVANQSNTLWMLTAAVTPALTALTCCGLENYVVAPILEKIRNNQANQKISTLLKNTRNMECDLEKIKLLDNKLFRDVDKFLAGKEGLISENEYNKLCEFFTKNLETKVSGAISHDIKALLENSALSGESYVLSPNTYDKLLDGLAKYIEVAPEHREEVRKIVIPTMEDVQKAIKEVIPEIDFQKERIVSKLEINSVKEKLQKLMTDKISAREHPYEELLYDNTSKMVDKISEGLCTEKTKYLDKAIIEKLKNLARVLGEFKEHKLKLNECKSIKFEYTNDTMLARYYSKFEKVLLDSLEISHTDLKKIRDDKVFARRFIEERFKEISSNEKRMSGMLERIGKVMYEMETTLHGNFNKDSYIRDLITAIELNYNNTAIRLDNIGDFKSIIKALVADNPKELVLSLNSKEETYDFLENLILNKRYNAKTYAKGIGSAKEQELTRLAERYQGVRNSFNRIIQSLDVMHYLQNYAEFDKVYLLRGKNAEYLDVLSKRVINTLLSADVAEHMNKLHIMSPDLYIDTMKNVFRLSSPDFYNPRQKGALSEITKNALKKFGIVLDRAQMFIARSFKILVNDPTEFMKENHRLHPGSRMMYDKKVISDAGVFNLVGQTPVDMLQGAAGRRFNTQSWVRRVGVLTGGIFGVALLSQLFFGKIRNPQNIQKIGEESCK